MPDNDPIISRFVGPGGRIIPNLSVKEAYFWICREGWDADISASVQFPFLFLAEEDSIPAGYFDELKQEPKCDCGGVKCKIPCYHWCSTQNKG